MSELKMTGIRKHLDTSSLFVVLLTLVLFAAALVVKGFGHDLPLEAGVFLVSVTLIMMAYKVSVASQSAAEEPATIRLGAMRPEQYMAAREAPGGRRRRSRQHRKWSGRGLHPKRQLVRQSRGRRTWGWS